MGSSGGGAGKEERWWENPKLSPADLRQHSETWSLADDAAMATLLQSISQRLVSRTHEVEEALEKVQENTDRIVTNIANTNNAFHMLANTQFIENRTYQDDADIAREKQETKEKPPVTEEEILGRCKAAIEDGLSLVARSYERHEIQDSDSDDDDTAGSPVPVYALIDPYESKPLPLIIGTEGFLADDKVGLEVSSSEENSRMTFSPDDTESEGELEDETDSVTLQQRAIPASSSRVLDDDSDSEWSGDDVAVPSKVPPIMGKEKQILVSSDEEDDMFVPSSRNLEKVGNIFSPGHNVGTTLPSTDANRRTDVDSNSEDEGLFGKEQKSPGLFGKPKQPSKSIDITRASLSRDPDPVTPSAPPNPLGVENVRAMPDITPIKASGIKKHQQTGSNLFGSDSDDDDLFSNKSAPSAKTSKVPRQNLSETQVTPSGGLFSSDEDSSLFSGLPPTQEPRNTKEDKKETSSQPKESQRKVPVGGVSIFGTAITSALKRQKSSDEESSADDFKEANTDSNKEAMQSTPKLEAKSPPKTLQADKGGLFDSDGEDNLFDTLVQKPVSVSKPKEESQSNTVSSLPENNTKPQKEEKAEDNEPLSLSWGNSNTKSTAGLFSDDDDDIFGAPTTTTVHDPSLPGAAVPVKDESPPKIVHSNSEESGSPRPTSIFASPPEYPIPSKPVNISETPKASHSLFSSPSDDDDDLFSSITKHTQETSQASAFMRDPPPLPSQSSAKEPEPISKGPTLPDKSLNSINRASVKANLLENPKETSSTLFSSPSDEEDIFSPVSSSKTSKAVPSLPNKGETESTVKSRLDINSTATETSKDKDNLGKEAGERSIVFTDEPPGNYSSQSAGIKTKSFSKEPPSLSSEKNENVVLVSKEDDIFTTAEDDIFGVTEILPKPTSSSLNEKVSSTPLTPEVEATSETSPKASEEAATADLPESVKNYPSSFNEEANDPLSALSSQGECDASATEKPKSSTVKPPVGGVALFGGENLDAEINSQKTLLKTSKNKNIQKIDDIFGDIDDLENANDERKESVFDDNDDIFGISIGNLDTQPTSSVLHRQSPPLLPEEIDNKFDAGNDLFSVKQKTPKNQDEISQTVHIKADDKADRSPKASSLLENFQPNKSENHEDGKSNEGISPRKKPIGGVSIFDDNLMIKEKPPEVETKPPLAVPKSSCDEPDRSQNTTFDQLNLKPDKSKHVEEGKDHEESSPRKKPPVGGVSVFGGSAMKNSELFAKVLQRKSMLAPESDSSEEDAPTESTTPAKPLTLPIEKGTIQPKSVSPVSPYSMYPPVFPPKHTELEAGGDEGGVSFDDPASQSNVLQSLNKTRARGSLKRRPPSRAHRKKAANDLDSSDIPQTSVSSAMPANFTKAEPSQPVERLQDSLVERDQRKIHESAEEKVGDISTHNAESDNSSRNFNTTRSSLDLVDPPPTEKYENVIVVDSKDVHETPRRALDLSKTKSSSKVKSHSLFDGSDSDEDLFGKTKQKSVKNTSSLVSRVPKKTATKSKSHTLFEDDDDDDASIFSSKSQVTKASAGTTRNISVTKPKGNLRQSSEPFEDPLLGNLTK